MSESSNQTTTQSAMDLGWEVLDKGDSNKPAKTTWPELVGLTAGEAEKKIKEELDGAYTPVVHVGGLITYDFRTNRVWLFVDDAGKVVRAPCIG